MAVRHDRSLRKPTGGRTRKYRKSRKHAQGSAFTEPGTGGDKTIVRETRGGNTKVTAKKSDTVNLSVNGETRNVEILAVKETEANPNYVRRSLLTEGTVIETEEGDARVTSRPGQDGTVNAVKIE